MRMVGRRGSAGTAPSAHHLQLKCACRAIPVPVFTGCYQEQSVPSLKVGSAAGLFPLACTNTQICKCQHKKHLCSLSVSRSCRCVWETINYTTVSHFLHRHLTPAQNRMTYIKLCSYSFLYSHSLSSHIEPRLLPARQTSLQIAVSFPTVRAIIHKF